MSKELFKNFVRNHPEVGNRVMNGETSWQKLYELYEIYGEHSNIWDKYIVRNSTTKDSSITDLISLIKRIDLDSVQKGVTNLQKTIGLLQDIGVGSSVKQETHVAKPLYKYFDD